MTKTRIFSIAMTRLVPLGLLFGAACGTAAPTSQQGPGGASTESTAPAADSLIAAADQWVADNAANDESMHLVARAFVNDRSEVMSFYEPAPGRVLVVSAGHPKDDGPSQLASLKGKSVEERWRVVAPGEPIPSALVDALGRQAAGVGKTSGLVEHPASAANTEATFEGTPSDDLTEKRLGTGYCDTQWRRDFPSNMTGNDTSFDTLSGSCAYGKFGNTSWTAPFIPGGYPNSWCATAVPYNGGTGCSCTARPAFGGIALDVQNHTSVRLRNEWENYANICPSLYKTQVVINSTGWAGNSTWYVNEDYWQAWEETGSVSCFFTTCTSTNDIGTFNLDAYTYQSFLPGYINQLWSFYGP
jgi:hypothetical protein